MEMFILAQKPVEEHPKLLGRVSKVILGHFFLVFFVVMDWAFVVYGTGESVVTVTAGFATREPW